MFDNGHGNELAKWNVHSKLPFGIDLEFFQDIISIEFFLALDP
jgi:hypothetical protein